MSVTVANNRFITSSLKGFYRCLTYHFSSFQALGERIIHEAETAQAFRQIEKLEELGSILSNFPIQEYRLAGQYYIGWCINRKGHDARELFEKIVEKSTTYRPLALIELASGEARKGNFSSGITYYTEAIKHSQNPYTVVLAERTIAAIKGDEGNHPQAIKGLERIAPLVRYSPPVERCQYLNSLAVELGEVGRIEEAQNVCRITLASPFINAYPEWRETWQELALRGYKSRSSVPVIQSFLAPKKAKNVLRLPERERPESTRRSPFFQPSDITSLEDWKNKMVKEPNGENGDESNIDEMSDKDILFEIMNLTSEDDITREQLKEILDAVRKITSKKP